LATRKWRRAILRRTIHPRYELLHYHRA
jgi:hypothetical protein